MSPEGRVLQASAAWAALRGRTVAAVTRVELWKLAHPDDTASLQAQLRALEQGAVANGATRLRFLHATGGTVAVARNASRFNQRLSIVMMPADDAGASWRPAQ